MLEFLQQLGPYLGTLILCVCFTAGMMLKGGWLEKIDDDIPGWTDNHLPPLLVGLSVGVVTLNIGLVVISILATYVWKFSMGEEAGAVLNVGRNEYIDTPGLGRSFGIKKAVQRGITDGAAFTLAFWNPIMLFAGLTFVPVYWVMGKIKHKVTKVNDWSWAEPVYGLMFGIFASIALIWFQDFQEAVQMWYNEMLELIKAKLGR